MSFHPSKLSEWFDPSPLIEADPVKDADEYEKEKKKKKGPDTPGEADQAPPAPAEPRSAGPMPAVKPSKMPAIEKDKPPHDLRDVQKRSEKIVDPMKCPIKKVTPQKKLSQMVQARASRRDELQDLSRSGLGATISMRTNPRSRYSGY